MISIPLSLVELGWTIKDYNDVAKNVGRVKNLPKSQVEEILGEADEKIPIKTALKMIQFRNDSNYDRNFCKIAGINYSNITQEDQTIIKAAIAEYALRVKGFRTSLQPANLH